MVDSLQHLSPKTMAALPKSPAGARRLSAGGGLRPVLPFGLDDGSAIDIEDEDEPEMGPAPREQSGPFAAGAGVDEVEYAYGYVIDARPCFASSKASPVHPASETCVLDQFWGALIYFHHDRASFVFALERKYERRMVFYGTLPGQMSSMPRLISTFSPGLKAGKPRARSKG